MKAILLIRNDRQTHSPLLGRTTSHGEIDLSRRRVIAVLSSTVACLALSKLIPWKSEDSKVWGTKALSFDEAIEIMQFHTQHKIKPDMPTLLGCLVAWMSCLDKHEMFRPSYPLHKDFFIPKFFSTDCVRSILMAARTGKVGPEVRAALQIELNKLPPTSCMAAIMGWTYYTGWLKLRILRQYFRQPFDHWRHWCPVN